MNTPTAGTGAFAAPLVGGAEGEFRKVLVVDDDPAMRRLIGTILASAGYEVAHAADGSEALEVLRRVFPSFVITDWDMPILDGAEFSRLVRLEDLPQYVYIIMLTGTHMDRLVEGLASGADDFVTKPLKPQELLARMEAGARVLRLEERLRLLASHDPLTELPNRRTFFQSVEQEWRRSSRIGYPLSCAMIDVDFFKRVNDTFGHKAGDGVLKSVSRVLKGSCRASDSVCRYGGEEFAVFLPNTDEQRAVRWAERCRANVHAESLMIGECRVPVTVSLGVAQRQDDTHSPERLLNLADRALLEAKRQGRNRVVAFGSLECAKAE